MYFSRSEASKAEVSTDEVQTGLFRWPYSHEFPRVRSASLAALQLRLFQRGYTVRNFFKTSTRPDNLSPTTLFRMNYELRTRSVSVTKS